MTDREIAADLALLDKLVEAANLGEKITAARAAVERLQEAGYVGAEEVIGLDISPIEFTCGGRHPIWPTDNIEHRPEGASRAGR